MRHATLGPETAEATDCVRIADLYERLARVTGSPVVEVNPAVALGMAYGPEAGLALLDQLDKLPALSGYHLLPSVRGDLLDKLGRHEEAKAMTQNEQERRLLLNRAERAASRAGVTLGCKMDQRRTLLVLRHAQTEDVRPGSKDSERRLTPTVSATRSRSGTTYGAKASRSIPCCALALPALGKHSIC